MNDEEISSKLQNAIDISRSYFAINFISYKDKPVPESLLKQFEEEVRNKCDPFYLEAWGFLGNGFQIIENYEYAVRCFEIALGAPVYPINPKLDETREKFRKDVIAWRSESFEKLNKRKKWYIFK